MEKLEMYFQTDITYRVTIENDGQDCDGPINHGQNQYEMSYQDLAARLGLAVLRHGNAQTIEVVEHEDSTFIVLVFSSAHDEGFSRTTISFEEILKEKES